MRKIVFPLLIVIFILLILLFIVLLVYFSNGESDLVVVSEEKLIIDHDGGADDAMAIFMALLSETFLNGPHIIGITTTHGNVEEPQAFLNTQRILHIAKRRDVPIYRGSSFSLVIPRYDESHYFGVDGLGDNDFEPFEPFAAQNIVAAQALIEHSKQFEGKLTVVAIGPLTNIALAIRLDPDFIGRLGHLYVGVGTIYGEDNPDPEFNALNDVEAYHVLAQHSLSGKVTTYPFSQVISSLSLSKEWRINVLGQIPTEIMKAQNSFERVSIDKEESWTMLDPAVLAAVLNENLINETRYSDNDIILCGNQRGIIENNFTVAHEANMKIIYSGYQDLYKDFLIKIFSAELPQDLKGEFST